MKKNFQFLILFVSILAVSCTSNNLKNGIWRGELQVQDKEVAFLFEVTNANSDSASVTLINGEERVKLTGVLQNKDSVTIPIEAYDAVIKGQIHRNKIEGRFIKNYIENDSGIPFKADFGKKERFEPTPNPTSFAIDGKWDILFIDEKGNTAQNVGIFKSANKIITGSVLTNSGDLRFLEGAYTQNGVQLSAFSGLSPYFLKFDFKNSTHFTGTFYTTRGKVSLIGTKNEKAGLTDPYSIAQLKKGYETLSFKLPDLDGKTASLQDEQYSNKVVIISILGSWCPNCLDEAEYLAPWYNANKQRGVEIIGLGFERKNDFEYAKGTLSRLKKKYNINYTVLFAGQATPENIKNVFPEIENFSGYPTTIFIDKKGKVRKIHTGFNGPATGLFYQEFKIEFNNLIDKLLAEK